MFLRTIDKYRSNIMLIPNSTINNSFPFQFTNFTNIYLCIWSIASFINMNKYRSTLKKNYPNYLYSRILVKYRYISYKIQYSLYLFLSFASEIYYLEYYIHMTFCVYRKKYLFWKELYLILDTVLVPYRMDQYWFILKIMDILFFR